MSKQSITLFICYLFTISILCAQNDDNTEEDKRYFSVNNSTLFGIGTANLYDTYLSPLEYKGTSFRLLNERMKKTSWFNYKFSWQQFIEVEFSSIENPAKNAREYSLLAGYSWGGHYNLINTEKFRFSAGGSWSLNGGVLYNQRNSNNPASARAFTNINLSAIAFYKWKNIMFRGQLSSPLIGVLFSPEYGQSYYEISLGNSVKVINFASLHNQRALRAYLTADILISKYSVRLGYLGNFYQTKVHNIQTHNYTSSLIIGLVFESINLSGNRIKNNKIIDSSYY